MTDGKKAAASLESLFHPRSIAVCGSFNHPFRWWLRDYYIDPFLQAGYDGPLYLVDAKGTGDVAGLPVHRSLADLPEPVDYVVCCMSAEKTPTLLEECRDKGVKTVQIFTAGFAEAGDPEATALQDRLVEIARPSGIRIIGPNCMGVYYPKGGLSFSTSFPNEPGPIGLMCQSGGNTTYITRLAAYRGLRFSKVVSYGNACDIDECDLLEYMTGDPETKVIASYIEGTRDGPRFVEALTRAASVKPVVVFKGGHTRAGSRATASHTGALAGSESTWDALLRQAGAIRVYSAEETVDMLMALVRMRPPKGARVCVVGNGGGSSVMATDECEQAGLTMAPIPTEVTERLTSFIPPVGHMLRNPIDCVYLIPTQRDGTFAGEPVPDWRDIVKNTEVKPGDKGWGDFLQVIEEWQGVDAILFQYSIDINPFVITPWRIGTAAGLMVAGARACSLPKAMVVHMLADNDSTGAWATAVDLCKEAELPLFFSLRSATVAIRRLVDYGARRPEVLAALHEEG